MRRKYLYELIVPDQRTHPLVLIFRFRHAKPPQRRCSELLFYQLSNGPGRSPLVGTALIVNLSLRFGLTNCQIYLEPHLKKQGSNFELIDSQLIYETCENQNQALTLAGKVTN